MAVSQHPFELGGVLLDVDVLERHATPLVVVAGGLRVGAAILAINDDHAYSLAARGESQAAFDGRCIPADELVNQTRLVVMSDSVRPSPLVSCRHLADRLASRISSVGYG